MTCHEPFILYLFIVLTCLKSIYGSYRPDQKYLYLYLYYVYKYIIFMYLGHKYHYGEYNDV